MHAAWSTPLQRTAARAHARLGGVALVVVGLWILLALLLPVPANAASGAGDAAATANVRCTRRSGVTAYGHAQLDSRSHR